jgi:hypothetical protein
VFVIVRAVEQCYVARAGGIEDRIDGIRVGAEFEEITAAEFVPFVRVVGKPLAQSSAGSRVLEPGIQFQVRLLDPSRPETFDKKPYAIGAVGWIVDAPPGIIAFRRLPEHDF